MRGNLKKELPEKHNLAVVRVEQLAPFPRVQLTPHLNGFKRVKRVIWMQEEPKNQGAWTFVEPRFRNVLAKVGHKHREVDFAGRPISASTATGYGKTHTAELQAYLQKAMQ